jgi:hypothetical protein
MTQLLNEYDDRLRTATATVETHRETLQAAQAIRTRLDAERRQASGRLGTGDVTAAPELDRLIGELVGARHAEQDARIALDAAQARVPRLQHEREQATLAELAEYLLGILDESGPALATLIEAQAQSLSLAIRTYTTAFDEAVQLARQASLLLPTHRSIEPFVARAVLRIVRRALPSERLDVPTGPEPALPQLHQDITRGLRDQLARLTVGG